MYVSDEWLRCAVCDDTYLIYIPGASGTPGGLAGNGWGVQTVTAWLETLQ